jgi:transposase
MANILKMAKIQSIRQLYAAGWSQRRIARELEVDRSTVARYLRPAPPAAKPAIPLTGSSGKKRAKTARTDIESRAAEQAASCQS